MKRSLILAACGLALHGAAAHAHDAWLEPSSTVLSKTAYITVSGGASTKVFVYDHAALRGFPNGFTATAPDGSAVAPENHINGKLRTVFDLNLAQMGTYRLALVSGGVMASWKEGAQTKRFRGNAETFARDVPADAAELHVNEGVNRMEAFVTVGKPTVPAPIGQGLELVPVTHPNDLYVGETSTFRFDIDGKPAAGIEVALVSGGARYADQVKDLKLTADADGKVAITWPHVGFWWLEASAADGKTTVRQAKERRLKYVATFEVLPQ